MEQNNNREKLNEACEIIGKTEITGCMTDVTVYYLLRLLNEMKTAGDSQTDIECGDFIIRITGDFIDVNSMTDGRSIITLSLS